VSLVYIFEMNSLSTLSSCLSMLIFELCNCYSSPQRSDSVCVSSSCMHNFVFLLFNIMLILLQMLHRI
jgi:hypothetical protein